MDDNEDITQPWGSFRFDERRLDPPPLRMPTRTAPPPNIDEKVESEQGPSATNTESVQPAKRVFTDFELELVNIKYPTNSDESSDSHDVCRGSISEQSQLLAQAIDTTRKGHQLFLDMLTSDTAAPFARFLSKGTYAANDEQFEDVPSSLLFHCQMYHLGEIYELPHLKAQAKVNVIRQCEFGCSSPDRPVDLCEAIDFVYAHLTEHADLIDHIICYCVACFLRHELSLDYQFLEVAYRVRPFHQALCHESMNREFEDNTAMAIIQMPFEIFCPIGYASREGLRSETVAAVPDTITKNDSDRESKLNAAIKRWEEQADAGLQWWDFDCSSDLEDDDDTKTIVNDDEETAEWEDVSSPPSVVSIDSDGSDCSSPRRPLKRTAEQSTKLTLPIRARKMARSAPEMECERERELIELFGDIDDLGSESDSDWSLVSDGATS